MKPLHEHQSTRRGRDKGMTFHAGKYSQQFSQSGEFIDKTQLNSTRPGAKEKLRRARKSKKSSTRQYFRKLDALESQELPQPEPND